MKPISRIALRVTGAAGFLWASGMACRAAHANLAIAAMLLLLEVFAIGTLGNWLVAIMASGFASLTLSYYFIDTAWSFRITTPEGAFTFGAMALTALSGSQLSVRAQRRAHNAILRREEMNRVNQFGRALLAAGSVTEAAQTAVRKIVELFGLRGAALRVGGVPETFHAGTLHGTRASVPLGDGPSGEDVLETFGELPSAGLRDALASMIRLVLERARSAEGRAEVEAVRRGEELRSTVLNALAHNLKTPLTSIKAAASSLRGADNGLSADERELIAVIDEEADRLNRLIRESLELAALEARQANPRTEQCRIAEIVAPVTARVARYLGRREFIIEIPEDLPPVTGDRFLLEQMLVQVVDNAWKYSRPGARIQISAVQADENIVLTVRNEGSEIPEEERARIFDKFYRGSRDRLRIEGTGMGLAIAKAIAEACKGRLWLEVDAHGPAFRFALPLNGAGRLVDVDKEPHNIDR